MTAIGKNNTSVSIRIAFTFTTLDQVTFTCLKSTMVTLEQYQGSAQI